MKGISGPTLRVAGAGASRVSVVATPALLADGELLGGAQPGRLGPRVGLDLGGGGLPRPRPQQANGVFSSAGSIYKAPVLKWYYDDDLLTAGAPPGNLDVAAYLQQQRWYQVY